MYRPRNKGGRKRSNSSQNSQANNAGNYRRGRNKTRGRGKSPYGDKGQRVSPPDQSEFESPLGETKSPQGQRKSPHVNNQGKSQRGRGKRHSGNGRGRGRTPPNSDPFEGRGFVVKAPRGFADEFQWMRGYKEQYLAQEKELEGQPDPFVFDPTLQSLLIDSDDSASEESSDTGSEEEQDEGGEGWFQDKSGDPGLLDARRSDKRLTSFSPVILRRAGRAESDGEDEGVSILEFIESDDSDNGLMNDDTPALDDEAMRDYIENTKEDSEVEALMKSMTRVDTNLDLDLDIALDSSSESSDDEGEDSFEVTEKRVDYEYMVGPWRDTAYQEEAEAQSIIEEEKVKRVLRGEFLPAEGGMLAATSKPRSFQERLKITRGKRHQGPPKAYGKKQKGKGKGKNFDSDNDEDDNKVMGRGRRGRKNRKAKRLDSNTEVSVQWVNSLMQDFIHGEQDYISLPPMNKKQRAMTHQMATLYRFESKSFGGGKTRHTILYRTIFSSPPDHNELNKLLLKFDSVPGAAFDNSRRATPQKASGGGGQTRREMDGQVVGASAAPISEENVGNRLLRGMGWTGGGLGAAGAGVTEPISPVVKNNRYGLGFGKSI